MALRIACDLDGTLADMEGALQREAERLFGPGVDIRARGHVRVERAAAAGDEVARVEISAPEQQQPAAAKAAKNERRPLTDKEMRQLWAHVREIDNFWTTLEEIEPGAVAMLAERAAAFQWEMIFLTQRPATSGETAQLQTQRWLAAHGFALPSVYVMNGSRGKVAEALQLDAVIDDRRENCLDVKTDSKARALLVWRDAAPPPPAAARLGITVVPSIAAAIEDLEAMMRAAGRQTLLSRVRAAIGL